MAIGSVTFNRNTQSQIIGSVVASADRPYLSSMSMIAPSPDWFTGLEAVDLRDKSTNTWKESITMETFPFDAGTDDGTTYRSVDVVSNPAEPIAQLTADRLASGALLSPDGSTVLPVARWECKLISQ